MSGLSARSWYWLSPTRNQEGEAMTEHPNVARVRNVYTFAKGDFGTP